MHYILYPRYTVHNNSLDLSYAHGCPLNGCINLVFRLMIWLPPCISCAGLGQAFLIISWVISDTLPEVIQTETDYSLPRRPLSRPKTFEKSISNIFFQIIQTFIYILILKPHTTISCSSFQALSFPSTMYPSFTTQSTEDPKPF